MAEIRSISEQLHRTLMYLDEGAGVGEAAMTEWAKPRSGAKRSRKLFFVFVEENERRMPLLFTQAVGLLASKLDIDEKRLLSVSNIPMRTFHRRQEKAETLSATETDRVLRIARVASQASEVFGDEAKARRWLSKPNRMLGATPLEMLGSDAGTHEVEAELHRIRLGDFA
jgi:putative toxin-antitoxin system antitoxin component (TIGR02293 family)